MALSKKLQKVLTDVVSGVTNRVSQEDGIPLLKEGLIQVDINDVVDGKALAQATDKGKAMVAGTATVTNGAAEVNKYGIMSGVTLPASQRGAGLKHGGAPKKYPFEQLQIGQTFFVPNSDVKKGNAVKSLGSIVSAQNMHYSEETGETKSVERTKRGPKNKALLDEHGNKLKEQVTVKVRKPTRKFVIRPVKAGQTYGSWVADQDGALIGRVAID